MPHQMKLQDVAGKSFQMVPEMLNDLVSLKLRGGAVMKNIYSGEKLRWGTLSGFSSYREASLLI